MKPEFDLKGKTAVVTGGCSGIGAAIATKFIEKGAHVIVLDMIVSKPEKLTRDKEELQKLEIIACDVTQTKEIKKIFEKITSKYPIDILVNNAGIAHVGNIENTSEEDFEKLFQVNVKGVYNCAKAAIPMMKNRKSGVILNMASIASVVGIEDRFAYSMSKGAVLTMTYSLAKDYINHGIRCNSISPARVHTPFVDAFIKKNYPGEEEKKFAELSKTQPIGRMGTPEEVALLALYLCSDEASFITGTNFPIDGGFIKLNG